MKDDEIHIGDVLRVRYWEDMKSEYGTTEYGVIFPFGHAGFHENMRHLCGEVFTVKEKQLRGSRDYSYHSFEGIEMREHLSSWVILSWMLEPYKDDLESKIPSDDEFAQLFS